MEAKTMTLNMARWYGLLIVLLLSGVNFYMHLHLPDAPMPVHFGMDGQADSLAPRDVALSIMPAMMLTLWLLLGVIIPAIMPKSAKIERSQRAYVAVFISVLGLLALVDAVILYQSQNPEMGGVKFILAGCGILFIIIGNYLPKTRRNYVMGIRTPWTLSDERVWDRTHQFSGPIFMFAGLMVAVIALCFDVVVATAALTFVAIGASIICVGYSYLMAKKLGAV